MASNFDFVYCSGHKVSKVSNVEIVGLKRRNELGLGYLLQSISMYRPSSYDELSTIIFSNGNV